MGNAVYYVAVVLGAAIFCICIVSFLRNPFLKLTILSVKQLDIILSVSLDEREKDRLILQNLSRLLGVFAINIVLFLLTVTLGMFPAFFSHLAKPEIPIDMTSIYFYASMILGSLVLFIFKKKKSSDYSYWSKLLHTIILDNYNAGNFLFKREVKKWEKKETKDIAQPPFVIVTGLARAGTTALTKLLYDPQKFHSINYANMPFLMSPNLWKKLYNPKSTHERERAHGDKVFFSENSIEALEEYFFKANLNDNFIIDDHLVEHEIDGELFQRYLDYQKLFKSKPSDNTVYLAKNNNFILRYKSMRKLDGNFHAILVFRNPIDHAKSLLVQHQNFVERQKKDEFVLDYMNWLGHYEFGLNQKYFDFGNEKIWQAYKKESINYWLAIWVNYYSHVLHLLDDKRLLLVHYTDLARTPSELKKIIGNYLEIPFDCAPQKPYISHKVAADFTEDIDQKLLSKAKDIYQKLKIYKV